MDIIIEVKNVSQNFQPEPISLGWLREQILKLYPKFDGQVRAIFTSAKEFEYNFTTRKMVPTERVSVIIYPKYVNGGMQPSKVSDFSSEAGAIAYCVEVFLNNSNNGDLLLPGFITIGTGNAPSYLFPSESNNISPRKRGF